MRRPALRWLTALALFLASFAVRIGNIDSALPGGNPQFKPFDDLYHLKRILYSSDRFPAFLEFDPDRGTAGEFCHWPPLYDLAAAGAARLTGARDHLGVMRRVTWIPPLVESLFAAAVAFALARRYGLLPALVGGAAVGFSPPLLAVSSLGDIDHHFLEPPLLLGIVGATVLLLRARSGTRARYGLAFGALFVAAILVQTTLFLAAGIALASLLLFAHDRPETLQSGAIGFGFALVAVTLYRVTRPAGYPDLEWFLGPSSIAALLAATVACLLAAAPRARSWPALARIVVPCAVGGGMALAVPGAAAGLADGAGLFGDPWIRTMQECLPIFRAGESAAGNFATFVGGGGILLVPFLIGAARERRRGRLVLGTFALVYLAATVTSRRFGVSEAPLLAVASALVVADLRAAGRRPLAAVAAAVALVPALVAAAPAIAHPSPVVAPWQMPMVRVARWLRDRGDRGRVLGPLSWGHLFTVVGRHPAILDNFGSMIGRERFRANLRVFLEAREEEVAAYCRRNGVRWVVLENPLRLLPVTAEELDEPVRPFWRPPAREGGAPVITRRAQASFWWRLYFDHGRARPERGRWGRSWDSFRLVYVDPESSDDPPAWRGPAAQVWEFVPAHD